VGFDFAGKVAAVTGGGSGIGLAIAERLTAEGALVAIGDIDRARVETLQSRLPLAMEVDVADAGQTDTFAAAIGEKFGHIDVVCANAGIIGPVGSRLWEVTQDDWRRVIDVNLVGVLNTLRSFVPWLLRAAPGHIAITSSMAGVTSSATMPAYFATKHALVSIAETLRLQVEREGLDIGVSVLLPARVTTNLEESLTGSGDAHAGVAGFDPHEMPPEEVADRLVAAVRANRLYAFTHAAAIVRVRAHTNALLEAFSDLGA
jgi:NAD(P)-dependent dehydrogenase (short-subunit alcohol dehydrogenase family)